MSGLNLLVFRGDRRRANGKELKAALIAQLEQLRSSISLPALLDVLLLAGEFECGGDFVYFIEQIGFTDSNYKTFVQQLRIILLQFISEYFKFFAVIGTVCRDHK